MTTSGDDYVEQLNEHIDNDDDNNKLVSLSIISASITFVKVAIILVISSSATAERHRDACVKSAILRGWVTFRLIFRFKVTFRANIYGPLDGEMVILQLYHWKFSHKETL